mmetsp:Transcript_74871/g.214490  ORF Transcript_74871/g.214490 Transcript_74871/m.214490 type:complete len:371 (+) Transcript_74871:190-1302(+)
MHRRHPDDQSEEVVNESADRPVHELLPRQVCNRLVLVVDEDLRRHQHKAEAVHARRGHEEKVGVPTFVAVVYQGVASIAEDAGGQYQAQPFHRNAVEVVSLFSVHLGHQRRNRHDSEELAPLHLHGALHLPDINKNTNEAGDQHQEVGRLVPEVEQEQDLHKDADDDALHRDVLVERLRVAVLEELHIVLERQKLEKHVQDGNYQSDNKQVRVGIGKEVAHLQHLLAVLTPNLCILLQTPLHVLLESPPGNAHQLELHLGLPDVSASVVELHQLVVRQPEFIHEQRGRPRAAGPRRRVSRVVEDQAHLHHRDASSNVRPLVSKTWLRLLWALRARQKAILQSHLRRRHRLDEPALGPDHPARFLMQHLGA